MADYFTQFSCELDVGANNVQAALNIYETLSEEVESSDGVSIGFALAPTTDERGVLWLHDNDYGDPEHVIAFVLKCAETFQLQGRWGFGWGMTCSRPMLDGFGGGAHVLDLGARKTLGWIDCDLWLAEQLQPDA